MLKMFRALATTILMVICLSPAYGHLALDHMKEGLESRFDAVAGSHQLSQDDKAQALSQIRAMQAKYSLVVTLSQIPSQKKTAEQELKQLNQQLQEFDKNLHSLMTE